MLSDEGERQDNTLEPVFKLFLFFCISYITDSSDNDREAIKNYHRGESGTGKDKGSVSTEST